VIPCCWKKLLSRDALLSTSFAESGVASVVASERAKAVESSAVAKGQKLQ